jgi:hypothetical protein
MTEIPSLRKGGICSVFMGKAIREYFGGGAN